MTFDIKNVKITVTVPKENLDILRQALWQNDIGIIGNYTHCSMVTPCEGTFMPNTNAHPYIGKANKLEHVEEVNLEIVCDIKDAKKVISKIREYHPYEEPVIDIIPLIAEEDLL